MPKKLFNFANLMGGKPSPARAAAEEEEDTEAEGEEEEDTEAKGEEEEDTEAKGEEEDEDQDQAALSAASARARQAERTRWGKVLSHAAAAPRLPLACHLLANTGMSAAAIIGALESTPASASAPALAARMAEQPNPNLGTGAQPGGGQPQDHNARLVAFAQARKAARDKRRAA